LAKPKPKFRVAEQSLKRLTKTPRVARSYQDTAFSINEVIIVLAYHRHSTLSGD
jgi:hypothetical protein